MQNPQYILKPDFKREFTPQIGLMVFLGVLFFVGLRINFSLLQMELPPYTVYTAVFAILAIILVNLFLIYQRIMSEQYLFYPDRLEYTGKKPKRIFYNQIRGIYFKKNYIDLLFNTGTIVIEPKFKIRSINNSNQIFFYIQRLVQYSRMQNINRFK